MQLSLNFNHWENIARVQQFLSGANAETLLHIFISLGLIRRQLPQ